MGNVVSFILHTVLIFFQVRPSANAEGDEFLRDVIGPNIPSLEAVKQMVYKASGASSYGNQHHEVESFANVAQVCGILVQEDVFSFCKGRGTASGDGVVVEEAVDLFSAGISRLATGAPLKQYKDKCKANWSTGVDKANSMDSIHEWDDVDALESAPGVLDNN